MLCHTARVAKGYFITVSGIGGVVSSQRLGHCLHVFVIDTQLGS